MKRILHTMLMARNKNAHMMVDVIQLQKKKKLTPGKKKSCKNKQTQKKQSQGWYFMGGVISHRIIFPKHQRYK